MTPDAPPPPAIHPAVSREQVMRVLQDVMDPELGMSIVELGLVYRVEVEVGSVRVTTTVTAPGCPLHHITSDWIRRAVAAAPGVAGVEVILTLDPPWTPDRIRPRTAP
jgi:metal-sulfur cluster biosynthetic enzyme